MSNRGKDPRRSIGGGAADLYLPHLRPKLTESHQKSPRYGRNGFDGTITGGRGSIDGSEGGSACSPK